MHTFIYVMSARQRGSEAGRRDLGAAAGCVLASVCIKITTLPAKLKCIRIFNAFSVCTYRCTQFECGSGILGAAAGLCTIYAVHKIRAFVCIYRCTLFYIYCRLLPAVLMCTYRCALFEDVARIYSVRLGCALFWRKNKKKEGKEGVKVCTKTVRKCGSIGVHFF